MPTITAPILDSRLNYWLYAGEMGIRTIQKAVTYAVQQGSGFIVIIPVSYGGSDTIGAVTGGNGSVHICDQRGPTWQMYSWNGTAYTAAEFIQYNGVVVVEPSTTIVSRFEAMLEPTPHPNGRIVTTNRASVNFAGGFQIDGMSADQSRKLSYIICFDDGLPRVVIPGDTQMGSGEVSGNFSVAGLLNAVNLAVSNTLTAAQINATNLAVSNPLTAANGVVVAEPSATIVSRFEAMQEPTPYSNGRIVTTNRASNSYAGGFQIDGLSADASRKLSYIICFDDGTPRVVIPAGTQFTVAGNAAVQGKLTLADPTQPQDATTKHYVDAAIVASGNFVYPGRGITVSTGTAWDTPIDPASVPLVNQTNSFTAIQKFAEGLSILGDGPKFPSSLAMAWVGSNGYIDAVGPNTTLKGTTVFRTCFSDGTGFAEQLVLNADGTIAADGSAHFGGNLTAGMGLSVRGNSPIATGTANLTFVSDIVTLDAFGAAGGRATFQLRIASAGAANLIHALMIDSGGNAAFSNDLTCGGTKNFRIPHPQDETKWLTHSCIEGPEVAVFYRGEATTKKGKAVVKLPDYFEALTDPSGRRTVQLTLKVDDEEPVFGGQIAAGSVKDGKFTIYSQDESATVYWEVKAVRAGVSVEVVSEREPEDGRQDFRQDAAAAKPKKSK